LHVQPAACCARAGVYLGENNNTMRTLQLAGIRLRKTPVIDNTLDSTRRQERLCLFRGSAGFRDAHRTSYVWNVTLMAARSPPEFLGLVEDHATSGSSATKRGFTLTSRQGDILYADGHATKDVKFFTNDYPKK